MKITEYVKEHPWTTGAIVLVGGVAVIFLLNSGKGSSASGSGDAATSAYFQAEAAQGVAGDQLQAVQIQAQATTAQDLIAANANENINTTWANADVTQTQSTNQTQVQLAPFAAESNIATALVGVAQAPPLVTTTTATHKNNGFFGIGGGSSQSTTTSETANPAAVAAEGFLTGLLQGFPSSENGHIASNG